MKDEPKKYDLKNIAFTVGTIISTLLLAVNFYNQKENDLIRRENDRINHRLDTREAYFNKGLIDGAKDREQAYFIMRSNLEQILKHCEKNPCNLPLNLSRLPEERRFESLETILTRNKE